MSVRCSLPKKNVSQLWPSKLSRTFLCCGHRCPGSGLTEMSPSSPLPPKKKSVSFGLPKCQQDLLCRGSNHNLARTQPSSNVPFFHLSCFLDCVCFSIFSTCVSFSVFSSFFWTTPPRPRDQPRKKCLHSKKTLPYTTPQKKTVASNSCARPCPTRVGLE